jgi:hypothetical protein
MIRTAQTIISAGKSARPTTRHSRAITRRRHVQDGLPDWEPNAIESAGVGVVVIGEAGDRAVQLTAVGRARLMRALIVAVGAVVLAGTAVLASTVVGSRRAVVTVRSDADNRAACRAIGDRVRASHLRSEVDLICTDEPPPGFSASSGLIGIGSEENLVNWFVTGDGLTFTAVDRRAFVTIRHADRSDLPRVSEAIVATLDQTCASIDEQLRGSPLPLCAQLR